MSAEDRIFIGFTIVAGITLLALATMCVVFVLLLLGLIPVPPGMGS